MKNDFIKVLRKISVLIIVYFYMNINVYIFYETYLYFFIVYFHWPFNYLNIYK